MALQPINKVEQGFVIGGAVIADLIGLIPILGNIVWFVAFVSINLYFLIKLGSRYFGGKRGSQKIATTLLSGMVGAMPVIGNIAPDLTVETVAMFWILDKEAKEEAEEAAKKSAANDNRPQGKLSRAA